MRFKKLSFILSALIATTLFAGCGNSSSTDSGKESSTTVNTDSGEEKVLKIAALEGGRGVAIGKS